MSANNLNAFTSPVCKGKDASNRLISSLVSVNMYSKLGFEKHILVYCDKKQQRQCSNGMPKRQSQL